MSAQAVVMIMFCRLVLARGRRRDIQSVLTALSVAMKQWTFHCKDVRFLLSVLRQNSGLYIQRLVTDTQWLLGRRSKQYRDVNVTYVKTRLLPSL